MNVIRRTRLLSPAAAQRAAGILLVATALLLYLVTLDNGFSAWDLAGGDLITHQYAQVQARPSNAPGYPLYTMGGWLWFHAGHAAAGLFTGGLPNPIPLLSSYSMLWALIALWLLYAVICRVTVSSRYPAGNWPLALLISLFYAVTYFFWYYATTSEQYSSAIAQTLAIVYLYLRWADAAGRGGETYSPAARRLLLWLAFLCGLSLAHMLTIALIVPPLVVVMLWQRPDLLRRPGLIVAAVAAAALPLLSYAYVYVRGAAHPEWRGAGDWATTGEWFWAFVSTAQGREELGWGFAPGAAFFGNGFPQLMWQELSIPLFVLGVVGIGLLPRKTAFLTGGFSLLTLLFAWAYRFGNWYQVILPVYPLLLVGAAVAIDRLQVRFLTASAGFRRAAEILSLLLLLVAIAWRIDASLPRADSRNRPEDTALNRAAVLLDQPLPAEAGLFAAVDDALALQYLTQIWGIRPDVAIISSTAAGPHLAAGGLVAATWQAADTLAAELPPASAAARTVLGPDWIAFTPGSARPDSDWPAAQPIAAAEGVTLAGYRARPAPAGAPVTYAQDGLDVELRWRVAGDRWPDGLNISVRPTQAGVLIPDPAAPDVMLQQDRPAPANGLGDPVAVEGGVLLTDAYRFRPVAAADGVQILLYRSTDGGFVNVAELYVALE
ncbi:MAG: DUF2723 domain-containing protein [Caldilineaceae bacterium]|nr:DUF2723 domain-containing protein [Caldilineaceae bacterium]